MLHCVKHKGHHLVPFDIKKTDWRNDFINNIDNLMSDDKIYQYLHPYYLVTPFAFKCKKDKKYHQLNVGGYVKQYYNKRPIKCITNYNAFYPQSFFPCYETLNAIDPLELFTPHHNFAFIDDNNDVGMMEACMHWCESKLRYEKQTYCRISLGESEINTKLKDVYRYLQHSFNFDTKCIKDIEKYYCNKKFDTVFTNTDNIWLNIFPLLMLTIKGTMLCKINDIFDINSHNMIKYLNTKFKTITLFKPLSVHPLKPIIYIYCDTLLQLTANDKNFIVNYLSKNMFPTYDMSDKSSISLAIYTILDSYNTSILNAMRLINSYDSVDPSNQNFNLVNDEKIKLSCKWATCNGFSTKSYFTISDDKIESIVPYYFNYNFSKYAKKVINVSNNNLHCSSLHKNKRVLNDYRRIIDTMEQFVDNDVDNDIIDWNKLTDCIDLHRGLKKFVAFKFNGEMVTNAWMKLYEMITYSNFIGLLGNINSFHICEAPGAFILSTNHFAKTQKHCTYTWHAQTLNPDAKKKFSNDKSTILCDDFGLIYNYRNRWLYGDNNTGDVTDSETIESYIKSNKLRDINFATGDAGLKIPTHMFNEQEKYVSKVTYGQVLSILAVLGKTHNCIFKAFLPLAEPVTISLLYILTTLFDKISIHKPSASHPSSAEVYVLCEYYYGIEMELLNSMIRHLDNFDSDISLLPEKEISSKFLHELSLCSDKLLKIQIGSISRSLYYRYKYYDNYDVQQRITNKRNAAFDKWVTSNNLVPLSVNDKIITYNLQKKH